jgi:hypothetical protein
MSGSNIANPMPNENLAAISQALELPKEAQVSRVCKNIPVVLVTTHVRLTIFAAAACHNAIGHLFGY